MRIIIVGGGITGLSTAYIAARAGHEVLVMEAGKSAGGLLNTFPVEGNRLEFFYHHFFTHDAEIRWMIKELGLEDKLIFRKTQMGIFRKSKIYNFSTAADLLKFKPLNLVAKIRFGISSLYLSMGASWKDYESVPAINWFRKYAGKQATNAIWKPMLKVKFGPYADEVPLSWMIGRLKQRYNSRKGGEEMLGYLDGSLQILLDALIDSLKKMRVKIHCSSPVQNLIFDGNVIKGVKVPSGEFFADKVVMTIPSPNIASLLRSDFPALAEKLDAVEYFGAVCTILVMKEKLSDQYWLNIADENFAFGGVIEHTNFIEPSHYNNKHIAYLSRYFAASEDIAKMSDDGVRELMISQLPKIYPDFNEGILEEVFVFRTSTAATVCDLNFSRKVVPAKTEVKELYIANMMHIYPDERSVNNSIRLAAEVCRLMEIPSAYVPSGHSMAAQIGFDD